MGGGCVVIIILWFNVKRSHCGAPSFVAHMRLEEGLHSQFSESFTRRISEHQASSLVWLFCFLISWRNVIIGQQFESDQEGNISHTQAEGKWKNLLLLLWLVNDATVSVCCDDDDDDVRVSERSGYALAPFPAVAVTSCDVVVGRGGSSIIF